MDDEGQDSVHRFFTDDDGISLIDAPAPGRSRSEHIPLRRVPTWRSVSSVATAVPDFGKIDLTLVDFCKYIFQHVSLQEARIHAAECYAESAGAVTHRFLVLELRRARRKDVYVRLDRRRAEGTSLFKFFAASGVTKANDRALIASEKPLLVGAGSLENRQDFVIPPVLYDLAQLLRIVCKEIVLYRLWPANCWFFCSLIQQHLEGSENGWFTSGALQYASIAREIRERVLDAYRLVKEVSFSVDLTHRLQQLYGHDAALLPSETQLAARRALESVQQWRTVSHEYRSAQAIFLSQNVGSTINGLCLLLHQEHRDNDAAILMQHLIKHQLALFTDSPNAHYTHLMISYHTQVLCLRSSGRLEEANLAQKEYNDLLRGPARLEFEASQSLHANPSYELDADDQVPDMAMLGGSIDSRLSESTSLLDNDSGASIRAQYEGHTTSAQTQQATPSLSDEGQLCVALDFGTTFSGISYGSSRIASGAVQQILSWPGTPENVRKIPTCLLYDETGRVIAWGSEAKNAGPIPGTIRCEWFKLSLEPTALRDESVVDPRLPELPPKKQAVDLIIDFLSCIWEYARERITREVGDVVDPDVADVWLTVPAAWNAKGCQIMRDAAVTAGLVSAANAGDINWRDRLHIITESEAATVHCAHLMNLHDLRPDQRLMICDAGGGTIDLAVYKITGSLQNLDIAEVCARSGSNCGSLFLDFRFRELIQTLLAEHPVHLDPASLAYFMHAFSETEKLAYQGESDDTNMFRFMCFDVEDPDDPSVGLVNGELAIPGLLLRREVFDPVVEQVLALIEEQMRRVDQPIDALLLVGGFSGSEHLFKRVDQTFSSRIKVIARPADADIATCRGAAQYGLARRPLVSSIIVPKSYILGIEPLAEPEDWVKRPSYIHQNSAGLSHCGNRLQYLVSKGTLVRKGEVVRTKVLKFSRTHQDTIFVAVIYTSKPGPNEPMRYTDEGEITALCRWTVDLGSLLSFQQRAKNPPPDGFYTDFELGLELDSAEVRGVLLYAGHEWSRATIDFLA